MEKQIDLVNQLRELLAIGRVHFTFRKKDGSIRLAHGTTNTSLFQYTFVNRESVPHTDMVVYWDLEKNGWRSFHEAQLCSIES